MSDTPLRPEDHDSLSLFPAEPVPPPAATEIDALIDAVSAGESPFPSERQSAAPRRITRTKSSGMRQQLATLLLLRPAVTRWVVPSAIAFCLGAMAVLWGLRVLQPVAPSEMVTRAEPAPAPENAAPRPLDTTMVSPTVWLPPGPPVVTGLPLALQQSTRIPVKPPVLTPAHDERRVAAAPPNARSSTALSAKREVPTPPAPVATSGSASGRNTISTGTLVTAPSLPALAHPVRSPADLAALTSPRTPASSPAATETVAAGRSGPAMADEDAVRETLGDYEEAVEGLDVGATAEVWPSVDRRALARVFAALKSQGLEFESCDVSVTATTATARCNGTLEFVRKVGSAAPMMMQQHWVFKMRKYGTEWKIHEVTASQASPLATQRTRGQH
jgi:hypothetical protein